MKTEASNSSKFKLVIQENQIYFFPHLSTFIIFIFLDIIATSIAYIHPVKGAGA
jgi:hypothetical protein